ncbi:fused response regulator/phosphatase [Teredinibacter sp. KSP-S5-2]|uniref:fused response regulator/phosphatase n=1 Tax=Teredinibacter sp. KSP-S5-2 TaxID=3034506 RepID=UPI00293419A0|nr:fused response regulator/phosphatase [Teredinibacter sp. KSP-S5-2]WNO11694.1 fused response regulator/phosphatase [Teredinibacter sp. KSP-S5-2]
MTDESRELLVIDDDNIVRESIVAYLEDSGFIVHQAANGRSGLEIFNQLNPQLVITDLRMPDIDGLKILKEIRKLNGQIPVIVISGMGVVRDVVEALRHGATDYLVKPLVDMEVLVHSIRRALERTELLEQNLLYRNKLERANRELSEYVRVLERDQKAGRRVQSQMLPETPHVYNQVEVSYQIIPSLYLSGDFVDHGLLRDRYLAFYLVDVSGHGAASAFVTVWLRQLVRRYFSDNKIIDSEESFASAPEVLTKLINQEVIQSGIGCHLTCFAGIIDTESLEMRYVIGGHLPLPILRAGKKVSYLQGEGKPIGIFKDASWQVQSVQLSKDFSIVVFSDGVLEVLPNMGLIEKEAYLQQVMSECSGDIGSIFEALGINEMDTAPDDIAVLKLEMVK